MSIGSKIAEGRKRAGMTQQQLAEILDVSFQAVSQWEREEYLPETDKLVPIANALSMKVSELFEEDGVDPSRWVLKDAMFSVEHMLKRVTDYARAKQMPQTLKAIRVMKKYHEGAIRKSIKGEEIPYIIHPLMLACHAFALGLDEDSLIAACLLHDVLEDTEATEQDLEVLPETIEAVKLVSFEVIDGLSKEESKAVYYKKIGQNRIATMVKILDRCNNVSTMATGFNRSKMAQYIDETEKYVMPLLDIVKHNYDEYYDAAFLLKYQIRSILETLKRTL